MKKRVIKVCENDDLLSYLGKENIAKNKVKTMVKLGFIYINDKRVVKLPISVKTGDLVTIDDSNSICDNCHFQIIYEDNNYLIVNKQEGILTISTSNLNKKSDYTLYREVRNYLNKKHEYAFIVNRIDKETSGIVVFVKNEKLKNKLQDNWNEIVKSRRYIAIVTGKTPEKGRIDNYLYEDKLTFVHSTNKGGKRAITNYQVIKSNDKYTMLDIDIETGRKNQIRVHMTEMNHPIVGDKKYYSKDNSLHRLCLHHYEISFIDPISGKLLTFTSKMPKEFDLLFNKK